MDSVKRVIFISKTSVEELIPIPGAAIISISDADFDEANISNQWKNIYRHRFVDGFYDEETLRFLGVNYKFVYSSYFNKEKSLSLRSDIRYLVENRVNTIIVNCHAGRSRSAAIAKYIQDEYGYHGYDSECIRDKGYITTEYSSGNKIFRHMNQLVYDLLNNPFCFDDVISSIESKNRKNEDTTTKGFFNRVKELLT